MRSTALADAVWAVIRPLFTRPADKARGTQVDDRRGGRRRHSLMRATRPMVPLRRFRWPALRDVRS